MAALGQCVGFVSGGVLVEGEGLLAWPLKKVQESCPGPNLAPPLGKAEQIRASVINIFKRENVLNKSFLFWDPHFVLEESRKRETQPMWAPG